MKKERLTFWSVGRHPHLPDPLRRVRWKHPRRVPARTWSERTSRRRRGRKSRGRRASRRCRPASRRPRRPCRWRSTKHLEDEDEKMLGVSKWPIEDKKTCLSWVDKACLEGCTKRLSSNSVEQVDCSVHEGSGFKAINTTLWVMRLLLSDEAHTSWGGRAF